MVFSGGLNIVTSTLLLRPRKYLWGYQAGWFVKLCINTCGR